MSLPHVVLGNEDRPMRRIDPQMDELVSRLKRYALIGAVVLVAGFAIYRIIVNL